MTTKSAVLVYSAAGSKESAFCWVKHRYNILFFKMLK